MKHVIITATFALFISFVQGANQTGADSSKEAFYSAFDELKNMLEGNDSLNYEKAVFITENAYYDNSIKFENFKLLLDFHTYMIRALSERARKDHREKYKTLRLYEQKMFKLNTDNWAIFEYMTDTTIVFHDKFVYCKMPYNYTRQDPYGSGKWENTQMVNLLGNEEGNCYALAVLFKIFSDRLKSDARLMVTPHHIYIQNRNAKGDFKNVELATKTFPGDGSIQVLTYTTKTSIMNGMAQRPLNDKEAVALNLIYLAKGFEHKFKDNTNDFLIKCADLVFKHDTLSMNALLLKAEVTENRLFKTMQENKITTVAQARANAKTQKLLAIYEKQLSNLYKCGYREIPKDIQHIILSAIQGNKDGYITTDKTPNPFAEFGQTTRYATLSGGLFDEMHYPVDTIQYFHVLFITKTKKIIEFLPSDTNINYKVDPVVFALSVDPISANYPWYSPYQFAGNDVIRNIDLEGLQPKSVVNFNPFTNEYKYTKPAVRLLSLVSGVEEERISQVTIVERPGPGRAPLYDPTAGGGAMAVWDRIIFTENYFESTPGVYVSSAGKEKGFGRNIWAWLSMSSHEVGHLPQADEFDHSIVGKLAYLASFAGEYGITLAKTGSLTDAHDKASREVEANQGKLTLKEFNRFTSTFFGKDALVDLFNSNKLNDEDKIAKIDSWWQAFSAYKDLQIQGIQRPTMNDIINYLSSKNAGGSGSEQIMDKTGE